MLSILRRKLVSLTNPKDLVELTAPLTIIQLIFGQLPYNIIKSPETNQYECRTSISGISLCIGYFLFSIMSLATYKHDVGEEVTTGISHVQFLIGFALWTTYSVCNFIVILLRKDTIRVYANLLNQITAVSGEPRRQPNWRRVRQTILALASIFLLHFVITGTLAYDRILNEVNNSTNSSISLIFLYIMPVIYFKLTILQFVEMMCLIHWHFSVIKQALNDVYRQEKGK